jgi:hypothetical protein
MLRLPINFLLDPRRTSKDGVQVADEFVRTVQAWLREIRECLENAQDIMVAQANLSRREYNFTIGDKVFFNICKLPIGYANVSSALRKLQYRFTSPFALGKQHGKNAFKREDFPVYWKLHNIFNVDRLKLDMFQTIRTQLSPSSLRSTKCSGDEFEVEAILDQ